MHHDLEDRLLWPRVREAVADRRAEQAVLEEIHAEIGPPAADVDAALGDRGAAPGVVRALREALEAHLRHEEATAPPLAEAVLAPGERRALAIDAGGRCGSATV